jgi:hypothetical protein
MILAVVPHPKNALENKAVPQHQNALENKASFDTGVIMVIRTSRWLLKPSPLV